MTFDDKNLTMYLVDLIFNQSYISLATCDNSVPWCAPLVYACDLDMNFYWVSGIDTKHSNHINNNPSAAIALFDSKQPQNSAQGLYIKGNVKQLNSHELNSSTRIFYGWRYRSSEMLEQKIRPASAFDNESPRRMYKLKIDEIFCLDPAGHSEFGHLLDQRVRVDILSDFKKRYVQECSHVNS